MVIVRYIFKTTLTQLIQFDFKIEDANDVKCVPVYGEEQAVSGFTLLYKDEPVFYSSTKELQLYQKTFVENNVGNVPTEETEAETNENNENNEEPPVPVEKIIRGKRKGD